MTIGSCLCGRMRYRAEGPFESMVHCHCSRCRRHHGAPYATFVGAPSAGFAWLSGADRIATYTAPGGYPRCFCPDCGSVLPVPDPHGDATFLPAGGLETCDAKPTGHMYAGSKAPWWTIADDLPRYDGPPPGYPGANVASPAATVSPGTISGGCLCAAVRYQVTPPAIVMVNCHCSRCRRARAAAHATNLFVGAEQLRFTAGEGRVRVFDLPGAERFGQNFCGDCGGKVARLSKKIGRWVVPAGSLDGDPGVRPALHIFVASKAEWDAITDALPQFEAAAP